MKIVHFTQYAQGLISEKDSSVQYYGLKIMTQLHGVDLSDEHYLKLKNGFNSISKIDFDQL